MAAVKNIIEVKNLEFSWKDRPVLEDVTFNIETGKLTVMIGRNGSGKSTLIRLIGGLLPFEKGTVKLNGKEIKFIKAKERARQIGFLAQKHRGIFPFSVLEVVLTGRAAYIDFTPSHKDYKIAHEAIRQTGIEHLKDRIYTELSGGEQQLVMIARVLAQEPKIILLDEPISHLDYNNQIRILKLCRELVQRGLTIVAVMHDPNMAFSFGDQFIFVHDRKVRTISLAEAMDSGLLNKIFENNLRMKIYEGQTIFFTRSSDKE
jgi:iron complex transport system ATP-binding protein